MHLFGCDRMAEPEFSSVKTETLTLGAIKFVTLDGTPQSVGVGTMDAQLMGAFVKRIDT